jgi:hypothetical protein
MQTSRQPSVSSRPRHPAERIVGVRDRIVRRRHVDATWPARADRQVNISSTDCGDGVIVST